MLMSYRSPTIERFLLCTGDFSMHPSSFPRFIIPFSLLTHFPLLLLDLCVQSEFLTKRESSTFVTLQAVTKLVLHMLLIIVK